MAAPPSHHCHIYGAVWQVSYQNAERSAVATSQVWQLLEQSVSEKARTHFRAFFSTVIGGITVDPALMSVPIDDHMVHRCDIFQAQF